MCTRRPGLAAPAALLKGREDCSDLGGALGHRGHRGALSLSCTLSPSPSTEGPPLVQEEISVQLPGSERQTASSGHCPRAVSLVCLRATARGCSPGHPRRRRRAWRQCVVCGPPQGFLAAQEVTAQLLLPSLLGPWVLFPPSSRGACQELGRPGFRVSPGKSPHGHC